MEPLYLRIRQDTSSRKESKIVSARGQGRVLKQSSVYDRKATPIKSQQCDYNDDNISKKLNTHGRSIIRPTPRLRTPSN